MVLALLALPLLLSNSPTTQESRSYFDAAQVVLNDNPRRPPASHTEPTYGGRFSALGDFDGDGRVDIVGEWGYVYSSDHFQMLKVWYGDGSGVVARSWYVETEHLLTNSIDDGHLGVGCLASDDGRDDFVYGFNLHRSGDSDGQLRVYHGSAADPILQVALDIEEVVLDIEVADFDGDGKGDFVCLLESDAGARFLRFYLHDGLGAGTAVTRSLPPLDWYQLDVGCFSGPSNVDVLVTSTTHITMRSLSPAKKFQHISEPFFREHSPLIHPETAVGDLDGDGDDDAVLFYSGVYRVLRQLAPRRFVLEEAAGGGPATDLADVDGDGDLDGICCGGGTGLTDVTYDPWADANFEIAINRGGGDFALSFTRASLASEAIAGAADFDGDGDIDLIAGRTIYFNPGELVAPTKHGYPLPHLTPQGVGDVDGDGDADFDLQLGLALLNMGDGSSQPQALVFPPPPAGTEFRGPGLPGDLDGDGTLDLLVESWMDTTFLGLHLLRNSGGGSFSDDGIVAVPSTPFSTLTPLDARSFLTADVEGDGDIDFFLRNATTEGVPVSTHFSELWLNQGDGTFAFGQDLGPQRVMELADLNGDGTLDLVSMRKEGQLFKPAWNRGLGNGSFMAAETVGTEQLHSNFETTSFWDPGLDKQTILGSGAREYYRQGVIWTYTWINDAVSSHLGTWLETVNRRGDINGDGQEDLIAWPAQGFGASMALGTPSGLLEDEPIQVLVPRLLLDVDGDGDDDAVTVEGFLPSRMIEEAGEREQFGAGHPGTGGVTPVLGATGTFEAGGFVRFLIRGGRGGATGVVHIGRNTIQRTDTPVPGVTTYVDPNDPYFQTIPITLEGALGTVGVGTASYTMSVPSNYAGVTEYRQVFLTDPHAAGGVSATNALRLEFGPRTKAVE